MLLALMLALSCVVLLAGCGDGSSSGGNTPPPADSAASAPTQEALDFWDGDWYGWWTWENGTGDAANANGGHWDCMAQFSTSPDGTGHVVIWDEDWAKDDGVSEVDYHITSGGGDLGTLVSDSGWFINPGDVIGAGSWTLASDSMGSPDFIQIKGHYVSSDDPSVAMDYTINLRLWGATWDDMSIDPPYYYDSWYLPLLESGEPMPVAIG
jgi:hypothetical protein